MYLSGSKWNLRRRRGRSRPGRVLLLLVLIGAVIFVDRVVVPKMPPLFSPTATATQSPVAYAQQATQFFAEGKLGQAEQALQQAISIEPRESSYYVDLARIQVFQGNYEQAEMSARNALLLQSESPRAKAVLGWVLDFRASESQDAQKRSQLLQDAKDWVEKALAADPNSALAHAYHAEVLIDSDLANFEQALREAQLAVQLDPGLLEAYRALGYVREMTTGYQEALEAYTNALNINPNLAMLHISVGDMHLALGQMDMAVEDYLSASALAPTEVVPLQKLAQVKARIGEFGQASQYARDAMLLDPTNPNLHGDLGRMYYKNNELPKAIEEFALAIHGGRMPAQWTVGGQVVEVADSTELRDPIEVGDEVRLRALPGDYGSLVAMVIELKLTTISTLQDSSTGQLVEGVVDSIEEGPVVIGLPLDPGSARVVEFYYTYGLALAKDGQCELAREIAQTLLLGVRDDELAVVNATTVLELCSQLLPTGVGGTTTPSP